MLSTNNQKTLDSKYIENDIIAPREPFAHKSLEERLAEYNGEITVCDFDWGKSVGREMY